MKLLTVVMMFLATVFSSQAYEISSPKRLGIFVANENLPFKVTTIDQLKIENGSILSKGNKLQNTFIKALSLKHQKITKHENQLIVEGFNKYSHQYSTLIIEKTNKDEEKATLILTYAPFYYAHAYSKSLVLKKKKSFSFLKTFGSLLINEAHASGIIPCEDTDLTCLEQWLEKEFVDESNTLDEVAVDGSPIKIKQKNMFVQPIIGSATTAIFNVELAGIIAGIGILTNVITRVLGDKPNQLDSLVMRYHQKHKDIADTLSALDLLITAQDKDLEKQYGLLLQEIKLEKAERERLASDILRDASTGCREKFLENMHYLENKEEQIESILGFLKNKGGFESTDRMCLEWQNLRGSLLGAIGELNKFEDKVPLNKDKSLKDLRRAALSGSRKALRQCNRVSKDQKDQCRARIHTSYANFFSKKEKSYDPKRVFNPPHKRLVNELNEKDLIEYSRLILDQEKITGESVNHKLFGKMEDLNTAIIGERVQAEDKKMVDENISSIHRITDYCLAK